jgi:hypothetical protein
MVTATGDPVGQPSSTTDSLAGWAAPYVTGMLGKGEALANQPYQAYGGPLTAGQSGLQTQAFQGLAGLTVPTAQMGGFTPTSFTSGTTAQDYMSPFMNAALEPQMAEAQRQAEIQRVQNASRLGKAGAFGGSRQAIMESEGQRNLLRNLADIYGTGMQTAYTQGMGQFNTEQDRAQQAQQLTNAYGLSALGAQQMAGGQQRDIEQQGIAADYAQFKEERDFPYKQVQFQQSLLQELPISATEREYIEPSEFAKIMGYIGTATEAADAIYGGTCPPGQSKNVFGICTGSTCPKGQSKNIFGFCS